MKVEFVTDTATMCIFDPASLKHRLDDDCDWWSIADSELEEVNRGNVAFLNLGSDGVYSFTLEKDRKCSTNPQSVQPSRSLVKSGVCKSFTFHGSSASTSSTVFAAGRSRGMRRSHVWGSTPLALAVSSAE